MCPTRVCKHVAHLLERQLLSSWRSKDSKLLAHSCLSLLMEFFKLEIPRSNRCLHTYVDPSADLSISDEA